MASKGSIDLRSYNFEEKGPVILGGEWEFFMSDLISPEKFKDGVEKPNDYISFPSTWNEYSKSLRPGDGFATYRLKMFVSPGRYALELPHFYSSYSLWINNKLIASNGKPGVSYETTKPEWVPQTVNFEATQQQLDLVIHVSNFHHAKGGVRENILLGTPEQLGFKRQVAVTSNIVMVVTLAAISIVFLVIYIGVRHEVTTIYFAALCFTWGIRALFSNLYVFTYFVPEVPWEAVVKVEYITLYMTMIWAIFFLASLFPSDINNLFKYLFASCNLLFVICTLFFNASLYTQFLPVYLSFALLLLLYIIYVLIHAVIYERQGVWLIVSSTMLGVIVFAYDLSAYEGLAFYNPIIVNFGYCGIFILLGTVLGFRLGYLKRNKRNTDMLTYEDLYGSNQK